MNGSLYEIVGMLMLSPIKHLEFTDLTEVMPVFTIIVLMSFTYNIGIGMTAGFVIISGDQDAGGTGAGSACGIVGAGTLSLLFFVFYPYKGRARGMIYLPSPLLGKEGDISPPLGKGRSGGVG